MDWTYFLACIISVSSLVAGQTPKYVLKGTWYNLKPDIPGQPSSILWKHNGNKVVEFDGTVQQVIGSYKNRVTLNWITAELKITDLRFEDSGNYKVEVNINNQLHTKEYHLEIIEEESSLATIVALSILVGVGTVLGMLFCKPKQKAPPMLDPQSKPFGHAKNDEGAEDDVPNKSWPYVVQEKAPSEETSAPDESPHPTEAPPDTPTNTENVHNKEPEVTEKTEENTTGPDLLSEQRSSSVPEQEGLDKTPLKKDSDPLKDEENTEETNQQNQGKQGSYVVQEKAPSEETSAPDESPHPNEAPPDTLANTENVHHKEPEVTEKTEENTTGPDLLSEQRSSSVPEQEGLDKTPLKKDSDPLKDEENTEETNQQNQGKQGYVGTQRKMFVQPETQKEANEAPASPPPVLDPQSKPFDQTKNDEGSQDDIPNKTLQEESPSEESPVLAPDESSLLTEAPPHKPAHTENVHNKEPEVTEQTTGTTTGSDSSLRQRLSSVPEQEDLDKTPQKKDSDPPKDEENTEETIQQNQGKQGYVKMNVKKFEQFMTQNEANKAPGSYVAQEKAPSEEAYAPATNETSHLTEISPDKPAHTANLHNKEPESTEETAETTSGPDLSSRQRSSSVPEQEGLDKTTLKKDSDRLKDEDNTEETDQQNQVMTGYVKKNVKRFEQFMTQNEANKEPGYVMAQRKKFEPEKKIEANQGPASPPPMLDPQSKTFDQTKNDEGGQDDVPNKSLQEKDPREETSAPTTDKTSHLTEASSDIHAHTENEDNKEPEITEETAGTTTGPDLSSQQRTSTVPEQEGTDTTPEKDSDSSNVEENTEETSKQNQAFHL